MTAPLADSASALCILWDVVEEHLDEAEFLFEQWCMLLDSPLYTHAELATGPEERLRANLDGLAIGADAVVERLLWPTFEEHEDASAVAAAALALANLPGSSWLDAVIAGLGAQADPERAEAIARALIAVERPEVPAKVVAALERAPDAPGRAAWLRVIAARGGLPGPALQAHITDPDPVVRSAAVRAARFAGRAIALASAEHGLADPEPLVASAAIEIGLVVGSNAAWSLAMQLATSSKAAIRDAGPAMLYAALLGEPALVDALAARIDDAEARPHVIWALGFSGRLTAADTLLSLLSDDELGPLAAEGFASITGLDRTDDRYWIDDAPTQAPDEDSEDFAIEDEDLDADLSGSPEDDLPRPNPDEIRKWWASKRPGFDARHRYIAGRAAHGSAYAEALAELSVRRRHVLALEIALRTRGATHLPTRSLSGQQRAAVAAVAGLRQLDGQRPFSRIS